MRDAATASITVVYLARLREALGVATERMAPVASPMTAGALRAALAARGGAWALELAPERAVRMAVNHAMAGPETVIADGDEVALFPPVTGG
jgi:molybdopterin synthase sulfur carrier subunit